MTERVGTEKITREEGWLFFLGMDGYVYKLKDSIDLGMQSSLQEKADKGLANKKEQGLLLELNKKEAARADKERIRVGKEKIIREQGYLYFIDKEGYVSRAKIDPQATLPS